VAQHRYLAGRVAWVTGGASGIGRATAIALARAGADVAIGSLLASAAPDILSNQDAHLPADDELETTKGEMEALGVRVFAGPLDVCSVGSVDAFHADTLAAFQRIDILVNAAGTWARREIVDHPDELWDRMIDTNLNGPYRTIKRCMPGMIERGWGRIITITSTSATVGATGAAAYSAAKAGAQALTRCVALEGAAHGITCNTISPTWVDTQLARRSVENQIAEQALNLSVEAFRAPIVGNIPQGRLIKPEEIAALVAFLCREEAQGLTMEDIRVSAGAFN